MERVLRFYGKKDPVAYRLGDRIALVGASPDSDIVLEAGRASDVAVKICPAKEGHGIEVLPGCKVLLNGKRVKKAALQPGDRIEINGHVFIYDCSAEQGAGRADPVLAGLMTFTKLVGRERDLQKLLARLMELLLRLLKGSDAFIFKLDRQGTPQVFVTTGTGKAAEQFSDTVVQSVLKNGKGVCIANALSDPVFSGSQSIADLKLSTVVCAPITIAGTLVGVIYIGSRKPAVSYGEQDLSTLSAYAALAGMLIGHIDYIERQSRTILKLSGDPADGGFIAESKAMQEVVSSVKSLAESDITVLIEGPTGSGKSHIAELIHKRSRRTGKPFLVVNCSSLHGELLESELFGHKKGSFTGAVSDHDGFFCAAQGGTLFLDEVGDLEAPVQAKLLRVIETSMVRPLGDTREIAVNVRMIFATNKNLVELAAAGKFRNDLFYRINQYSIRIPPLSSRGNDVVLLAYFFLEKFTAQYPAKEIADFHPETLDFINKYEWPGNIRELANAIHRAVLSADGPLLRLARTEPIKDPTLDFETATNAFQKELFAKAIRTAGGSKEEAAKLLGLGRSTFFRYLSILDA